MIDIHAREVHMRRFYITRKTDEDEGAEVEVSQDLWQRISHMIADDIVRGKAHYVKNDKKRDQPRK